MAQELLMYHIHVSVDIVEVKYTYKCSKSIQWITVVHLTLQQHTQISNKLCQPIQFPNFMTYLMSWWIQPAVHQCKSMSQNWYVCPKHQDQLNTEKWQKNTCKVYVHISTPSLTDSLNKQIKPRICIHGFQIWSKWFTIKDNWQQCSPFWVLASL